ncbi:MAG: hypothetical protein M3151_14580 [Actinomycetota bacterium]|nr:hypothetical protein [Actinomycetota bacterium]
MPQEQLESIEPCALRRQFARTLYAVSFHSGKETFILLTLYILCGEGEQERLLELRAIAPRLAAA